MELKAGAEMSYVGYVLIVRGKDLHTKSCSLEICKALYSAIHIYTHVKQQRASHPVIRTMNIAMASVFDLLVKTEYAEAHQLNVSSGSAIHA